MIPNHYQRKYAEVTGNGTSIDVIAAVTGKRIVVLHWCLSTDKAAALIWKSATTALNGAGVKFAAAGTLSDDCADGLFQTAAGEKLALGNADGAALGGYVVYIEF